MKDYPVVSAVTGHTPLVRLAHLPGLCSGNILCKLEFCNPASSIKDRIAVNMIDDAEKRGVLRPGGTIIEATSGNTGLGLAMTAAARGYKLIIAMPESMSRERRLLMQQLGARLVLTEAARGMAGSIAKADELAAATENCFMPRQFENPANPAAHELTTGPEILRDTAGRVDIFVAGIGTGGTVSGVGRALKKFRSDIEIYGVEPDESAVLSGDKPGPHGIQGIGAGFKPKTLDMDVIDGIIRIRSNDAIATARELAAVEGILAGISTGANIKAALLLAARPENRGKNIVTVACDTGERYLSTALFAE
ncbi:MAG: cysteine synthase A [Victivallales bacterium]|nr:cysteine synthase A [Victivallales bacterium]